jgi:hypothetical protein
MALRLREYHACTDSTQTFMAYTCRAVEIRMIAARSSCVRRRAERG